MNYKVIVYVLGIMSIAVNVLTDINQKNKIKELEATIEALKQK